MTKDLPVGGLLAQLRACSWRVYAQILLPVWDRVVIVDARVNAELNVVLENVEARTLARCGATVYDDGLAYRRPIGSFYEHVLGALCADAAPLLGTGLSWTPE